MDKERASTFISVVGLEEKHLLRFGLNFCFTPLILDNILSLIKSEDYSIREATSNLLKQILTV